MRNIAEEAGLSTGSIRHLFVTIIQALTEQNFAMPDLDFDIEVERFYALIDGLAIYAVLGPEVLTMEKTKAVLHRHLQSLGRA